MYRPQASNWIVPCLTLALVTSFFLTQRIVTVQTLRFSSGTSPFPFPFLEDAAVTRASVPFAISLALFAMAVLQSLALYAMYRVLLRDGTNKLRGAALACGVVVLTYLALQVPVLTSADVYSYAGYAKTSSLHTAYAPTRESLGSDFDTVKLKWGNPLDASAYGPLWLGGVRLVLEHSESLRDGVMRLRVINVFVFAALLGALVALRFSLAAIAVVALNPAVYALYVWNAHNDIVAVAAIALGLVALSRKSGASAFAFAVVAGLIKLPLLLVAATVLVRARNPLTRALGVIALGAVTLGLSALWGGNAYVRALLGAGGAHANLHGAHAASMLATQIFVAAGLSVAAAVAFCKQRYASLGAFTFAGASSWFRPWYLIWGLPYAMAGGERTLVVTAIALPIVYGLSDPWSSGFVPFHLVTLSLTAVTVATLWQLASRTRTFAARPTVAQAS